MEELRKNFYFFCRGILYLVARLPPLIKSTLVSFRNFILIMIKLILAFFFPMFFLKNIIEKVDFIENTDKDSFVVFIAPLFYCFCVLFQLIMLIVFVFISELFVIFEKSAEYDKFSILVCLIVAHQILFIFFWIIKKVIVIGKNNGEEKLC